MNTNSMKTNEKDEFLNTFKNHRMVDDNDIKNIL